MRNVAVLDVTVGGNVAEQHTHARGRGSQGIALIVVHIVCRDGDDAVQWQRITQGAERAALNIEIIARGGIDRV